MPSQEGLGRLGCWCCHVAGEKDSVWDEFEVDTETQWKGSTYMINSFAEFMVLVKLKSNLRLPRGVVASAMLCRRLEGVDDLQATMTAVR